MGFWGFTHERNRNRSYEIWLGENRITYVHIDDEFLFTKYTEKTNGKVYTDKNRIRKYPVFMSIFIAI